MPSNNPVRRLRVWMNQLVGILGVLQGGTGASSLTSKGVVIGNGTNPVTSITPGSFGNYLMSNGTDWTATLGVDAGNIVGGTIAISHIPTITLAKGGLGADNSASTGVPYFSAGSVNVAGLTAGRFLKASSGTFAAFTNIVVTDISGGQFTVNQGGTGIAVVNTGDTIYANSTGATAFSRLSIGQQGTVQTVNSSSRPSWQWPGYISKGDASGATCTAGYNYVSSNTTLDDATTVSNQFAVLIVKNTTNVAITINTTSSQALDDDASTSYSLGGYKAVMFWCDGAQWHIIAKY